MSDLVIERAFSNDFYFRGEYGGRSAVIKQLHTVDSVHAIEQELDLLSRLQPGDHVVAYYGHLIQGEYTYFIFEDARETLNDVLLLQSQNMNTEKYLQLFPKGIPAFLESLAKGLNRLHSLGIVHRSLNPASIWLMNPPGHQLLSEREIGIGMPKLAEIGQGKCLTIADRKYLPANHPTTVGVNKITEWTAPECLQETYQREKQPVELGRTRAIDIFALGCIFYQVVYPGKHPFESKNKKAVLNDTIRNYYVNPKQHRPNMENVHPTTAHLLRHMLAAKPEERLTAEQVLDHPYFWDDMRCKNFIADVRIALQAQGGNARRIMEHKKHLLFNGGNWRKLLSTQEQLQLKHTEKNMNIKYGTSVFDYIRFLRNTEAHMVGWKILLLQRGGTTEDTTSILQALMDDITPGLLITCFEWSLESEVPELAKYAKSLTSWYKKSKKKEIKCKKRKKKGKKGKKVQKNSKK